jgi:hypothetical protein
MHQGKGTGSDMGNAADPVVLCDCTDSRWETVLASIWPPLVADLNLGAVFGRILVCADESPEEETTWFHFPSGRQVAAGELEVEFHCSTSSLVRPAPDSAVFRQPAQIWDSHEGAWEGALPSPEQFSETGARIFFYHNFLLLKDLAQGRIEPRDVPAALITAFETAWEVVVDGRLARSGLPGYALEERRNRFSRTFSSAGVLMPNHWEIYQSLWDGGLDSQPEVLGVLRQLPLL